MTDTLSKRRLKLWLRLLRTTRGAEARLREHLRQRHATTLPRFDVMAALHRAHRPLTMTELSRLLLVSNGNATAVVDRLQADGLVQRAPAAHDRRTVQVSLTPAGEARFAGLACDHEAMVNEIFGGLDAEAIEALGALLKRHDNPTEPS